MKRTWPAAVAASLAAAALVAAAGPATATAVPVTPGATAYSAPANTGTASLAPRLQLSGSIGGLLGGLVEPVVTTALNPLVAALQSTVNSIVAASLGASSSLTAGTPGYQGTLTTSGFPNDTFPALCPNPDGTTPCYQATNPVSVNAALVALNMSLPHGYTQETLGGTNPIYARAQISSASVSSPFVPTVPGLPVSGAILSVGASDALASCPNDGSTAPSTSLSAVNLQLFGGLIGISLANGKLGTITVSGTPYTLSTLPATAIAGVKLSSFGTSLKVTIPLTLTQIMTGLGLPSVVTSQLLAATPTGSLNLSVIVGPNRVVTATSAKAWGLGVGVDLSGSLGFNLLGLVGATVTVPTGIGGGNYGNVVDVRLGYVACTSGTDTPTTTRVVPPALV